MRESTQWAIVARLVRPQGRHGELLADILTDFPARFATLSQAFLQRPQQREPEPVSIERAWLHKNRVVLKLGNIDSISDAEELRGAELLVPSSQRIPLEKDAVYIDDLIGCTIIDRAEGRHTPVGKIINVVRQKETADLLIVTDDDGTEHSIPFVKAHVALVDLPARIVEMNLPAGLLEVNAPMTAEERKVQQHSEPDAVFRKPRSSTRKEIDNG